MATVVFADPAYDRELSSPSRSTTKVEKLGNAEKLSFLAVDLVEYDVAQTIYFAFGEVNPNL